MKKKEKLIGQINTVRNKIIKNMREIETLKVICPNCDTVQASETCRSKTCIKCHRSFKIFPKSQPSRVYHCREMFNKGINIRGLKYLMLIEEELMSQVRDEDKKEQIKQKEDEKLKQRYGL